MKILFIAFALLALTHALRAQSANPTKTTLSISRWVIGLETDNLGKLKKNPLEGNAFQRRLIPTMGYQLTPTLVLGIGIPIGVAPYQGNYYSSGSIGPAGVYPTTLSPKQIGVAPFVQQFMGQGKLRPFVGASYRYSYEQLDFRVRDLDVSLKQTGNESELALFGGLTYWLGARLGLDAKLRYGWQWGQYPYISFPNRLDSGYSSSYGYRSQTASINVGLRYLVGHKSQRVKS